MGSLERIRRKVRIGQYDMSGHAMEEMAEDGLDILDVENVILKGALVRTEKDDPRGTKYVIMGPALDGLTPVEVVGRITAIGEFLIITVYALTDREES
jgi:hypothetical protein